MYDWLLFKNIFYSHEHKNNDSISINCSSKKLYGLSNDGLHSPNNSLDKHLKNILQEYGTNTQSSYTKWLVFVKPLFHILIFDKTEYFTLKTWRQIYNYHMDYDTYKHSKHFEYSKLLSKCEHIRHSDYDLSWLIFY